MEPSLKWSCNHEVIEQWSARPLFLSHYSVLTYCWFQFVISSEKRVLRDFRWFIRHLSSVDKSAGLNKFVLFAGPRFDSSQTPVKSNHYCQQWFEQIDPQARVLNFCFLWLPNKLKWMPMFSKFPSRFLNGFGALKFSSPGTCCLKNSLLTPLRHLVLADWRRLMGLTASQCDLNGLMLLLLHRKK